MDFVTTAGSNRKHDSKSTITITNWLADGSHFCVDHSSIVPLLFNRWITIEGYCMVFHMADGKFDEVREYINPPGIVVAMLTTCVLRLLPFASRMRGRKKK